MDGSEIRVLLVDDDEADAMLTRRMLADNPAGLPFHVEWARSLADELEMLRSRSFDVVLQDLGLPESSGLETLARVREQCDEVPIVMLTGLDDEFAALTALDAGAQDYVIKGDMRSGTLARTIRFAIQRQQLRSALQGANLLLTRKNDELAEMYETAQRFVDNVSHEFRTPLTVIREFASIIRDGLDGPITEKQAGRLDKLLMRTDDLALMVDDMLDISKLEAGLLRVRRRPCLIEDIFTDVKPLLERRAENKQVTIQFSYAPDLFPVFCDDEKARRVIVNLAINAIKVVSEGGHVDIQARRGEDGHSVAVSVTDDGPGISRENLEVIFQRFKQLDNCVRSSTKGFGLGLNIAKELVHLNLGAMDVASEVGRGTTFSFTLPAAAKESLIARYVHYIETLPRGADGLALLAIDAEAAGQSAGVEAVAEFLQEFPRPFDLIYQTDAHKWLLVASCAEHEVSNLVDRMTSEWQAEVGIGSAVGAPELSIHLVGVWRVADQKPEFFSAFAAQAEAPKPPAVKTILVVDDDREVVDGLEARLQAAGYDVLTAYNGRECVEVALKRAPDGIVMDIWMPEMDGIAAIENLKLHSETKDTPIVVLSASVRDQQRALDAGASVFIEKPFQAPTVLTALERSLNRELPA